VSQKIWEVIFCVLDFLSIGLQLEWKKEMKKDETRARFPVVQNVRLCKASSCLHQGVKDTSAAIMSEFVLSLWSLFHRLLISAHTHPLLPKQNGTSAGLKIVSYDTPMALNRPCAAAAALVNNFTGH